MLMKDGILLLFPYKQYTGGYKVCRNVPLLMPLQRKKEIAAGNGIRIHRNAIARVGQWHSDGSFIYCEQDGAVHPF